MDKALFSEHCDASKVRINDSFWNEKLQLVRHSVIPYQYEALHDRIKGAEKSYAVDNFIKAAKVINQRNIGIEAKVFPTDKWHYNESNAHPDSFHGWVFQDSDVYKWLEAVAYSLINSPDAELEKRADDIIDIIGAAQLADGYLDTLFIINDISKRFTNLKDWHELYCFGHLAEAAVAYYKATGKDKLLVISCRFADFICENFGKGKCPGYPGHEIAEMALVKLYNETGRSEYLDLAEFFIEERGKKPYYYDVAEGKTTVEDNYHYNQAHCQPKYQYEAVGHAVRAVYLYSGMADVSRLRQDKELYNACQKLADNIINRKMYITGGIGASADGESFSFDYNLPNDLAYNETCASIGLIFFLRRMLEIRPDALIGDAVERALYNTVLSGMSLDGQSFFYVNPLEVLPEATHKDPLKSHIKGIRQKWFGCACCPPNLARIISSVGEYAFTENKSVFYVHQYIGADIKSDNAEIEIISDYLNSGRVSIKIRKKENFTLAIRIPFWCKEYSFTKQGRVSDGYVYFDINDDCEIGVDFKVKPRLIKCSEKVRVNIGKVALTRGPFIYCLEEADNGTDLHLLSIDRNTAFFEENGIIVVEGYKDMEGKSLYTEWSHTQREEVKLKFIPYYKWANRGEGEMQVYVRIR